MRSLSVAPRCLDAREGLCRMTTYRVAVIKRPDGSADGWLIDLSGCRATAPSFEAMWELLPAVAGDHLAWLARHGESVAASAPAEFKIVEESERRGEVAFDFDRAEMSRDELERGIGHASYAHADFLTAFEGLPDTVLDWRPPASAVKIDQVFPDVRSIRQMVEHCLTTEARYYFAAFSDQPPPDPERVPAAGELHEATAARLRAFDDEALSRLFKGTGPRGETEWTVRKVLRRIIIHKRFHTREIEQRLSWLTLGVPEILPVNRE
jgi:hypothetical protein